MRVRLPGWPSDFVSVPIGLEVYLKEEKAEKLGRKYVRRSRLGQRLVKRVAEEVGPDRRGLSVQDGNYATQYFLQDLPENVSVVGRMPKNAALYERPGPHPDSGRESPARTRRRETRSVLPKNWSKTGGSGRIIRSKKKLKSGASKRSGTACCRDRCSAS